MRKETKTFTILIISLILILLQTIGAFYSKSCVLFSYVGLIIMNAFSSFLEFIRLNEIDENLQRAQIVSIILNSMTLFILVLVVINKASIPVDIHIQSSKIINTTHIAEIITTIVFVGLILCSFIDRHFILTALLSLLIVLGFSAHIFEKITSLNYHLSIFFTALIAIKIMLLIKNSVKMLKNKRGYSVLSPKKL